MRLVGWGGGQGVCDKKGGGGGGKSVLTADPAAVFVDAVVV